MSALLILGELRARRWWRRQLRGALAGRLSEADRKTIEARFAYGHPDPDRAYTAMTIYEVAKDDSPELLAMTLRNFAAALRAGEDAIDVALLGAAMKATRERASGVPADRAELMGIFRAVLGEEARRLGLDDAER